MNEDLAEAIALGHDLGHTPFGHSGEVALKEIYSTGFSHNLQSLRVVDILEKDGNGLNLTHEVRDGIVKHSKGFGKIIPDEPEEMASTIEGQIVRIADIMAYLNHDLDDAIRSGVVSENQVPEKCLKVLGYSHSERATAMIQDLIFSSQAQKNRLQLKISDDVLSAMMMLRKFLYDNVYRSRKVEKEFEKAKKVLSELYTFFLKNEKNLLHELENMEMSGCYKNSKSDKRIVCDFIASLTDRYALDLYKRIFLPSSLV